MARGPLYEGDDPDSAMLRVYCQSCKTHIADVARDEVEKRIDSGRYVTRRAYISRSENATFGRVEYGIYGLCRTCTELDRVKADQASSDRAADAQMVRIRGNVAQARKERPDFTLEQAVGAATAWEFRPSNELDRGFRAYLLGEGAPKNPELDAKARALIELLGSVPNE